MATCPFFDSEAFSATAMAASPLNRSRQRSSTSGFRLPLPVNRKPSGSTATVYSAPSMVTCRLSSSSRTVVTSTGLRASFARRSTSCALGSACRMIGRDVARRDVRAHHDTGGRGQRSSSRSAPAFAPASNSRLPRPSTTGKGPQVVLVVQADAACSVWIKLPLPMICKSCPRLRLECGDPAAITSPRSSVELFHLQVLQRARGHVLLWPH